MLGSSVRLRSGLNERCTRLWRLRAVPTSSKDEAVILVALTDPRHLVSLPRTVALKCFPGTGGELHATAASGGLWKL